MTDLEKFEQLMLEWGLIDKGQQHYHHIYDKERPYIYHCSDSRTLSINAFTEVWYFDMEGKFLYIEETYNGDYLHRGGEAKSLTGREHFEYED